ncbi:LysR family transcriptional regulator [Alkalimarinus coralli]|uniref:LysR family transcriptional regulator n=1 Tax=Alkalimarinus coralli TaxID=2935863 RepID=UPI00202AE21C|nr:LysR family transcriptional regulator [Alkalimarinus coralli]
MRNQELNLLVIFDAIMTERSITRAAKNLSLTQPAVSNALSRMRVAWKDELFVKDGRNIQPTLYAQNLWSQIKHPLEQLEEAIDSNSFDPATAKRTFRIATVDVIVQTVWPPLRKLIEQEAPGINIHAVPYTIFNAERMLHDAEVDMVVGASLTSGSVIRSQYLYTPCYICVMRPKHPLAKANLTLEEFADAEHLLISLSGDATGFSDNVLAQHGLSRRVAMTVNHFSAVPALLKETNLISIVPSTAVEKAIFSGELTVVEPPIQLSPNPVACYWHKRQERDQGLIWLRQHVNSMIKASSELHLRELKQHICKECA